MKKSLIAAKSLALALGMIGIAHADSSNWTGFYAGVDMGVAFSNIDLTSHQLGFTSPSETCNRSSDFSNFLSGIQFGYMHTLSHSFVAGIEVNPTFNTDQKHTLSCKSNLNPGVEDSFTFRNQLQTSLKGRVGRAFEWNNNRLLPYFALGPSFANLGLTYHNEGGNHYTNTGTQLGWLIGAGLEWAFAERWSLRAEYNYMDYGNAISVNIPTVYDLNDTNGKGQVSLKSNTLYLAVNYWI